MAVSPSWENAIRGKIANNSAIKIIPWSFFKLTIKFMKMALFFASVNLQKSIMHGFGELKKQHTKNTTEEFELIKFTPGKLTK
jgi:hypothetical protein